MAQKLATLFEEQQRALLKVDEDDFFDVNVALVEEASDHDTAVIVVATQKPYIMFRDALQDHGVDMDEVHFVDCIVKTLTNKKVPEADDVLYLKRTDELRNISTAVFTKAQSTGQKAVLVIDSLKALLAAHDTSDVTAFIQDIEERLDTTEMNLVLFYEGHDVEEEIGQELYDIVDNVIFLRGDDA
jgi:archaellum biogenesis ATPase FlaH